MNTVLAAPPLSQSALKATKVYLFLVKPKNASREHIAGCVLAQRISNSLAVLPTSDTNNADAKLVHGLYCAPEPHPTPLGIPRVFVPTTYRRKGIARALIDAAARTAIHGCPLDPRNGQLAFSQPTDSGRRLMDSCGVQRVYEEEDDDLQ
ncbi:hypothetical protein EXIGLDRAFT_847956 [Exidia glandulosa HHB12029]|uniref:N-acetyltransferase ESCO acetyl-transferase domain-containing protein n=1 Tax=Exidia glandulosa HHB12029 TaxID=1314781 RepID=A0A166MAF5_EXIGL|nr:hypothetical protein EXIGLDRAFT_847956 [Exidia glandulosa HHB12029]